MKILFISHNFPPESFAGVEIYTYNLARELIGNNHEVSVFYPVNKIIYNRYDIIYKEMDDIHCYMICNYLTPDNYVKSYDDNIIDEKYEEILDIVKPDIVHINHLKGLSFGIIGRTRSRGIPSVISLHDYWIICTGIRMVKNNQICLERNDLECLKCVKSIGFTGVGADDISRRNTSVLSSVDKADVIIALTLSMKNIFSPFLNAGQKFLSLNNGVSGERVTQKKKPGKKIVFGYCGSISQTKGVHLLLGAFEKIRRENGNTDLYVRGNITTKDFEKHLDENFPGWRKYYRGPYESEDIYRIMSSKITVLVVPSAWHDIYPTVINEAFLSGIPVIGSNLGGIPEMIDNNETGLLFDPFDENDLRSKMMHLVENPGRIEYMKENVLRKKIKSMKEHALELEEIYRGFVK